MLKESIYQEGFKEGYFLHNMLNTRGTKDENTFIHTGYTIIKITVNLN